MLSFDSWRACRLVVDTGLHQLGWSRGQAVDYLLANSALTRTNVENEVDRYVAWPGQALAYMVGRLELVRLRELAQARLGGRFDLRAFHDVVLGTGGVPLSVLAEVVEGHLVGDAMATTNDLKNGMTLNLDGNLMNVVEFQHVKPGKGGAFVRTKLKNVRTGRTLDKTFRADEPVEVAILEKREMQYLYRDETGFVFMDTQTYDQAVVDADAVGGAASWLTDGATPYVTFYEGHRHRGRAPAAVELQVTETEPGIKGDRVSGATKPATVETGAVVQVPLFVETGDRVKVDTRSGAYLTRVQ